MQLRSLVRPILVVGGGVLLAWAVLSATMERIFARSSPALALFWSPRSADANVHMADRLLAATPTAVDRRIGGYAARSLARQPVNPGAARLLAITASQQGNGRRAASLIRYSEAMSRRELATQLFLIESSVAQGDVAAALVHYDRALKSSNTARGVLFPILTQAANDRAVWQPLARVLATRPQWGRAFLEAYVPASTTPDGLYAIARALRMDRVPSSDPWMLQAIEKRLVDLRAYPQAAALYNRAHGLHADDRTPLRNGGFEQPGNWDPFDWNLVDEQDLAATRQPSPVSGGGLALFLTATNGRGGEVAAQLMMLPPGRYQVEATVGGVRGDPLAFPQLGVKCARDGRDLLQASFPAAPDTGRRWRVAMTVPAGCAAQRLILRAASTLDAQTTAPWIDSIAVRRQGAS